MDCGLPLPPGQVVMKFVQPSEAGMDRKKLINRVKYVLNFWPRSCLRRGLQGAPLKGQKKTSLMDQPVLTHLGTNQIR